ncbi:MAG: hypothetical protein J5918_01325, partial [Prevotella sp.]|nr:hypothetical protein [Prevotella sp.]
IRPLTPSNLEGELKIENENDNVNDNIRPLTPSNLEGELKIENGNGNGNGNNDIRPLTPL